MEDPDECTLRTVEPRSPSVSHPGEASMEETTAQRALPVVIVSVTSCWSLAREAPRSTSRLGRRKDLLATGHRSPQWHSGNRLAPSPIFSP